jgi:hypothetical protein
LLLLLHLTLLQELAGGRACVSHVSAAVVLPGRGGGLASSHKACKLQCCIPEVNNEVFPALVMQQWSHSNTQWYMWVLL